MSAEALHDSHIETLDMLVIGAGISGVGAAWHLKTRRPDLRFAVLEAKSTFGGTWVTHRFPGVRSDSDLFTFGYRFKPWRRAPIATAEEILHYLGEIIADNALAGHFRYGHRVLGADWSSAARHWVVRVERDGGQRIVFYAKFLWMCQGYYRHDRGYVPQWAGMTGFNGRVVHPQEWPEDLQLAGKRVVVVGSGATAATLVPALSERCASLTLLQRSPTWYRSGREIDALVGMLRELEIPDEWVHEIARRKVLLEHGRFVRRCQAEPDAVARELLAGVRAQLGPQREADVQKHFTPRYQPWRQRVAFLPDGDMLKAVATGGAQVLTDEIERFEAHGLRLKSGGHLPADVVITATGFELCAFGDIAFAVDGRPVDWSATIAWRGAMFTGVPNLMWVFGYIRVSWTLRVDLLADLMLRLLDAMDERDATTVMPQLRAEEDGMALKPWIDPENFNPGYLMRGMHLLPRQGAHAPWRHGNDYWADKDELPAAPLDDGTLRYD